MLFHSGQGAGMHGQPLKNFTVIYNSASADYGGTLAMPTGIQLGDLLIVSQHAGSGGASTPTITISPGTGFTLANSATGTYTISTSFYRQSACVSYKIANGTESGTNISGFMNSTGEAAVLFHIRANKKINSVSYVSTVATSSAADIASYNIITSTGIEIPFYSIGANTPVLTLTPDRLFGNTATAAAYGGINSGLWRSLSTSSTYTVDPGDGGNMNTLIAGRFIIS